MNPIKVLIVDDQHLFAESLKFVLQGAGQGRVSVVGIAEDGSRAVATVETPSVDIDVILMDIRMPVMDGVEATRRIHARHPQIKIMILTTFDDDELAISALSNGATGYVLKDVDPSDLILSIEAVAKGSFFLSPSVGFRLFDNKKGNRDASLDRTADTVDLLQAAPLLTRREAEIAGLAARALTNKGIAEELNISEKTVKNHLASIYEKLSVHNRLELMNFVTSLKTRRK